MKTTSLLKLLASAALFITSAVVAGPIVGSKHDLGGDFGANGDDTRICVYCHTPHNSNVAIPAPLWNRDASGAAYVMYDSPTLDMVIGATPQGVSLGCLSCHDGTIALDDGLTNPSGIGTLGGVMTGTALLGIDLSNDHPISITYNPALDAAFNTITVVAKGEITSGAGTVQLFDDGAGNFDQVECASCHNVHDNTIGPFLRFANTASGLCQTCHNK